MTTPYTTAAPLFTQSMKPTWVPDELDVARLASYALYENIYWTVPDTYKLTARGYEDKPIYVPSGRTIVEATNRYTTPGFKFRVAARADAQGTDTTPAQLFFDDFFRREEFFTRYAGNKRFGIIRGDWLWHITADDTKPAGSRISINSIDPGSYFPITDDDNVDKIVGCHIVSQIKVGNDDRIHRLTYRKVQSGPTSPVTITVEEGIFKLDKWGGPNDKPEKVIKAPTPLDARITSLPVYHIKNFEEPQNPFGSSDLRGFERIMGAVNQAISDEELALALDGIGAYVTDAPQPTDDDGSEVPWRIAPGSVISIPAGRKFDRVSGVSTVNPVMEHIGYLTRAMREASATPDIAVGVVDVAVAQSGIALALQLGPILSRTDEKDGVILDKHTQMAFDLRTMWAPAYEGANFDGVDLLPAIGDKVPVDRTARLAELDNMLDRGVIDAEYYRTEAAKLGYAFPADIGARVATEQKTKAANADPFGGRLSTEDGGDEA